MCYFSVIVHTSTCSLSTSTLLFNDNYTPTRVVLSTKAAVTQTAVIKNAESARPTPTPAIPVIFVIDSRDEVCAGLVGRQKGRAVHTDCPLSI